MLLPVEMLFKLSFLTKGYYIDIKISPHFVHENVEFLIIGM